MMQEVVQKMPFKFFLEDLLQTVNEIFATKDSDDQQMLCVVSFKQTSKDYVVYNCLWFVILTSKPYPFLFELFMFGANAIWKESF